MFTRAHLVSRNLDLVPIPIKSLFLPIVKSGWYFIAPIKEEDVNIGYYVKPKDCNGKLDQSQFNAYVKVKDHMVVSPSETMINQ